MEDVIMQVHALARDCPEQVEYQGHAGFYRGFCLLLALAPLRRALVALIAFFFSSGRRHTRLQGHWSSDVCSSDLSPPTPRMVRTRRPATRRAPRTSARRVRSEERRVGKECRSRGSAYHAKKKPRTAELHQTGDRLFPRRATRCRYVSRT